MGGILPYATKAPLMAPITAPIPIPNRRIRKIGVPGYASLSIPLAIPLKAMIEPTERSIPFDKITKNSPIATIERIEISFKILSILVIERN